MAPPQWAYQLENFVTKPDDELICSICHSVFCNPVMSPCDHVFCKVCITKWLQNNRNCPICRKRVPRYSIKTIVPIVKNLIMKLTLYCKNKEQGCESQVSLEGCEVHMKECNFEMVRCKNKPCKEKLFRKDLEEHETNGCTHRYIKCLACGSKKSLVTNTEAHVCITALQMRLRRKNTIIRKKNERIKELRDEIKNLKDTPHRSAGSLTTPSTVSSGSVSPDEIRINIAESLTSDSEDSSDSYFAIIANGAYSSDGNQSDSFEGFLDSYTNDIHESPLDLSEFRNAGSQTNDDVENSFNLDISSPEYSNNQEEDRNSGEGEDVPHRRRPPKRRLPTLLTTSEDDNDSEGRQSWSSSKRSWLSFETTDIPTEVAGSSSMDAGPSASYAAEDGSEQSNDNTSSNTRSRCRSGTEQSAARTSRQRNIRARKSMLGTKSSRDGAVFKRTLSLLQQYNLESDPEWFPEYASHRGNTTSESDSSDTDDIEALNESSSSLTDSDTDFSCRI